MGNNIDKIWPSSYLVNEATTITAPSHILLMTAWATAIQQVSVIALVSLGSSFGGYLSLWVTWIYITEWCDSWYLLFIILLCSEVQVGLFLNAILCDKISLKRKFLRIKFYYFYFFANIFYLVLNNAYKVNVTDFSKSKSIKASNQWPFAPFLYQNMTSNLIL